MLDPAIRATFTQTFYVAPVIAVSGSGDVINDTPQPRQGRIQPTNQIVASGTGEEFTASRVIFTEFAVGSKDRVWMPGQDPNDDELGRIPKSVEECVDLDGDIDHYEVFL